jgi:hypothetical protein
MRLLARAGTLGNQSMDPISTPQPHQIVNAIHSVRRVFPPIEPENRGAHLPIVGEFRSGRLHASLSRTFVKKDGDFPALPSDVLEVRNHAFDGDAGHRPGQ